ncbi:ABC transporter ATP-binding protein [Candidatus Saccharibacteria bacterium]|nr:ABC transporter ATP-binding protein [Candidatus Saccharibacteria bacterium]
MLELKKIDFWVKEGKSKKKILDDFSLRAKKNELMVITGANGSGKSTLVEIMMGIKKPSNGKVFLNGKDITDLEIFERAKLGISLAFQQPVKFKGLNVYDLLNIAKGELISEQEAEKYLKRVGLLAKKYLFRGVDDKLSGGELKRIEVATILAKNSDVMIFDEPEAGIDLWSFDNLVRIFKKLKTEGKTLIIISHQEKILKLAERILVVEQGKIKILGKPEKVLAKITGEKNGA